MDMLAATKSMRHGIVILLAMVIFFGLVTSAALAQNGYALNRQVVASGGGHLVGGSYTLDYTVGQAVTGTTQGGEYELCSGFWCSALSEAGFNNYLPLIVKK
jgi:hypothetical protein